MRKTKKPVVLMFVKGEPSAAQAKAAEQAGARIRDVSAWHENDAREVCDFVMGDVPEQYKDVPKYEAKKAAADKKAAAE